METRLHSLSHTAIDRSTVTMNMPGPIFCMVLCCIGQTSVTRGDVAKVTAIFLERLLHWIYVVDGSKHVISHNEGASKKQNNQGTLRHFYT